MSDTVVFIPAWNEEQALPGVLAEAHGSLPDVDLLVIDDGSTDGTAAAARAGGADVVSFHVSAPGRRARTDRARPRAHPAAVPGS